jgi:hypothetical protein
MTVRLMRPQRPRVRLGSTLAGEPVTRRRSGLGLVRLAVGALLAGILLGLALAWQQSTTSPANAFLLGGAVLVWLMLSFGRERPS